MNAAIAHCVIGAKSSSERASGANPPSGIVLNAYETASNGLMASSSPASQIASRTPISTSVSAI